MRFGVLGPLYAIDEERDITPTAPKQRQLLALLLMNANRPVPVGGCVEELWDNQPPTTAVAAVQTYVKDLRQALRSRLVTNRQGYQLRVEPGELDADVFAELARQSRRTAVPETLRTLRRALRLWRGDALVDVTAGPLLHRSVVEWEGRRLATMVQRIGIELATGRHHELIAELSALVRRHPTHEELTAQLMLALYRSGRQADAITAFHRLRQALRDELGTVPSAVTQRLNTDILSASAHLEHSAGAGPGLSLDLATDLAG
jgi:SARP family transcriptional regulator, regulator of embCAB operon